MKLKYTLKYLKSLPTLCTGQTSDLKIETPKKRIWLARTGVTDGEFCNNKVSVEVYKNRRWEVIETYKAE